MRYLLLIYGDEKAAESARPEDRQAVFDAYFKYSSFLTERGANLAGEALVPTEQATTVRVRDGKTMTTDGPFAETKEQLGGFYMVEAANLDEAIEYAEKLPGSWHGSVEIRPIFEFEAPSGHEHRA
jgi:hypothetical protein